MAPTPRKLVLLAFVTLFCGTASGCRSVWVHEDWTESLYREDIGDCAQAPAWKLCMLSKGWNTQNGWFWSPPFREPRHWYEFWR